MKKTTIIMTIVLALMAFAPCFAQQSGSVTFGYDANGNRISREISMKKVEENGKNVENDNRFLSEATDVISTLEVELYPNPTTGKFSVSMKCEETYEPLHLVLFTPTGVVLADETLNSDCVEFDLLGQASGVYFLKLVANGESHTWKIVKK